MELKCAAYDTPYKNEVSDTYLDGFDFTDRIDVKYKFDLNSGEDISSFKMTLTITKPELKNKRGRGAGKAWLVPNSVYLFTAKYDVAVF